MLKLVKAQGLNRGDKVATVSLSWGGAGDTDLLWRYNLGKKRLQEWFGLEVVEMPNTLKGSDYLYHHPEKRAEDLMAAFSDTSIKAIFSCIGGNESVRMLSYIDFNIIKSNPKIFIGYSDATITHFMCLKANLSSFYGASILAELAENIKVFDYTSSWLEKVLFDTSPIGLIPVTTEWTGERIEWSESNANVAKTMVKNQGYEFLQGKGVTQGHLIGGCIEVMEMIKGTSLWPSNDIFEDAILFFETSEDMPGSIYIEYWLRNYGSQGILQKAKAIIFGKPYQEKYYNEYKNSILKILLELGLYHLPIVYNMSFGHNEPMICLPYGAMAEIDCDRRTFSILESGVV
ncbi:S66 family peptidase [Clostridium pasteurianum]|uniref:Putative MccF-like protein (Microcin C7 resistance) n=1 Tax=Clostridium pasteurianum BC1 TaxID=86416 RepID=R4JZE3_CLOPA|nr:S66 peptidase family protein [Clostridium pasteurianum]AGK96197.1 putative MccF-like protein (microcin C7 resistance) [Clostridium pasteurianum BC1]